MTRAIVTALVSCGITGAVGYLLLPLLRAPPGTTTRQAPP